MMGAALVAVPVLLMTGGAGQAQQISESPRQRLIDDYTSLEGALNIAAVSKLRTAEDMRVLLDQSDRQAATLEWYRRWVAGMMVQLKSAPSMKK